MARGEVEQVLCNWISQANSPIGSLPTDADRAQWVARQFLDWWEPKVKRHLLAADGQLASLARLAPELGISRWTETGDEALHLLESLRDEVSALRSLLGVE